MGEMDTDLVQPAGDWSGTQPREMSAAHTYEARLDFKVGE